MSAARDSLAVLPAREVEEDRLEARRQARRVADVEAELGGRLHEPRENSLGAAGAYADDLSVPLDRADAVQLLGALGERRGLAVHGDRDQRLGAVRALQRGGRVDRECLAVVDDR